jgi:hypothetical protein
MVGWAGRSVPTSKPAVTTISRAIPRIGAAASQRRVHEASRQPVVECCIDPRARRILFVMARYLPIIIVGLLMIYCVVEVAQAPPYAVRRMPRWLWATAIICLPLAGAVCWLLLGRPTPESSGIAKPKPPPKAPDDDIDFLRGL